MLGDGSLKTLKAVKGLLGSFSGIFLLMNHPHLNYDRDHNHL